MSDQYYINKGMLLVVNRICHKVIETEKKGDTVTVRLILDEIDDILEEVKKNEQTT